jgi:hypothetical protein
MAKAKFVVTLLLLLLMFGSAVGESVFVAANPVPWPTTPNKEKPVLTIQSPHDCATYKTEVPIDFNVTRPESWGTYYWNLLFPEYYIGELNSVTVYLDSTLMVNYSKYRTISYFDGIKTIQYSSGIGNTTNNHYSIRLNQTTSGSHTLNVTVLSYTYARGDALDDTAIEGGATINGKPVYKYPNVVSEVVHFTVEEGNVPLPTETPVPSAPEFSGWVVLPLLFVGAVVALVWVRKGAVPKLP